MASLHNDNRPHSGLHARWTSWWRQPVFLGLVGLGVLLVALALQARSGRRPAPDHSGDARVGPAPEVAQPPGGSQQRPSRGHPGSPPSDPAASASTPGTSTARPSVPAPRAGPLDALVARVNQSTGGLTREDATATYQMLQELRADGTAAVPTIRDLLHRVDHHPTRLALFDLLYQIGGSDAIDVLLEQIDRTMDPVEIATLGWHLDQVAPGVYREAVLKAARETLQWAEQLPPEDHGDMSPLFVLLQAYGGPEVVAALERYKAKWWEYSLLALATLPAGEGLQPLAALAGDPSVPLEYTPKFPFRMLAQASAEYPEAGMALLELARTGYIPDEAWGQIGAALEGKHLQFSPQLFGGTPLRGQGAEVADVAALLAREDAPTPLPMRYAQWVAAAQWSAEQIHHQLVLIDGLLDVTDSPAAVAALRQARASLQHGRH